VQVPANMTVNGFNVNIGNNTNLNNVNSIQSPVFTGPTSNANIMETNPYLSGNATIDLDSNGINDIAESNPYLSGMSMSNTNNAALSEPNPYLAAAGLDTSATTVATSLNGPNVSNIAATSVPGSWPQQVGTTTISPSSTTAISANVGFSPPKSFSDFNDTTNNLDKGLNKNFETPQPASTSASGVSSAVGSAASSTSSFSATVTPREGINANANGVTSTTSNTGTLFTTQTASVNGTVAPSAGVNQVESNISNQSLTNSSVTQPAGQNFNTTNPLSQCQPVNTQQQQQPPQPAAQQKHACQGCGQIASSALCCPVCVQFGRKTFFCNQVCFAKNWGQHQKLHTLLKQQKQLSEGLNIGAGVQLGNSGDTQLKARGTGIDSN